MPRLAEYLSIAGIAHRQLRGIREEVDADRQLFPSGEQVTSAIEIACCETIICSVKAALAAQHHLLEFAGDGKARARVPFPLQKHGDEPPVVET